MSDHHERQYVTVAMAAELTGVPARTLRRWTRDGQLPAVAATGGRLVALDDVERLAAAKRPEHGHAEWTATVADDVATAMTTGTRPVAEQQLATLRDGLVAPLIELTERQQAIIMEQAEELGRVKATSDITQQRAKELEQERDALRSRLSEIERQQAASSGSVPVERPEQPKKPRQRRWWLRLFGIDE